MRPARLAAIMFIAIALLSGYSHAQTVKVGVINTYSGPLAAAGDQIERASTCI